MNRVKIRITFEVHFYCVTIVGRSYLHDCDFVFRRERIDFVPPRVFMFAFLGIERFNNFFGCVLNIPTWYIIMEWIYRELQTVSF